MNSEQMVYLEFYLNHYRRFMSEKDFERLKKRFACRPPDKLENGEKSVDRAVKKFNSGW